MATAPPSCQSGDDLEKDVLRYIQVSGVLFGPYIEVGGVPFDPIICDTLAAAQQRKDAATAKAASGAGAIQITPALVRAFLEQQPCDADIDPSSPQRLCRSSELCDDLAQELQGPVDRSEVAATVAWILPDVVQVAITTSGGSFLVLTLLEVADTSGRFALVAALAPHTMQLMDSENGFYVLEKAIEEVPCEHFRPVIRQIEHGGVVEVAKKQFGCRIIERLMEFCPEDYLRQSNSLLVESTAELCSHVHGHLVIQALFEHYPSCHDGIVARMMEELPHLAKDAIGCHVVSKALRYAARRHRVAMVSTLLEADAPNSIEELASSEHGAVVIEELLGPLCSGVPDLVTEVQRRCDCRLGLLAEPPGASQKPLSAKAC